MVRNRTESDKSAARPATVELATGDCLELMRDMDADSADLVFGSPPYEDARTYGIDYKLAGDEWVEWMFERTVEDGQTYHLVETLFYCPKCDNYGYVEIK